MQNNNGNGFTLISSSRLFDGTEWLQAGTMVVGPNGIIVEVGSTEALIQKYPAAQVENLGNLLVVPGTVNAHNHSFQSLMRGLGDDKDFFRWRDDGIYKYSLDFGPEEVYTGALLAFGEMALRGVTTVCDFFYLHNHSNDSDRAVIRAAQDVGIRLVLARCMMDWMISPPIYRETPDEASSHFRELASEYKNHPMVKVIPAPHSPHAASAAMVQAGAALAEEFDTPWHIHVAEAPYEGEMTRKEYGLAPLEWLQSLEVLSKRTCIVHGVWLEDSEINALGEAGGSLIYNPSSNMFLGDGITPLPKYREAGVNIALATDGGCSNNRVSVFGEMRQAALLQKVARLEPEIFTAEEVFQWGTAGGGKALGLPLGRLETGAPADFVALDPADLSLQPLLLPLKNVVYAMESTAIHSVYVSGRAIVRQGQATVTWKEELYSRLTKLAKKWGY
ncbi:MAG TPA: amidohydrolase [Chloroflexia bacterium]|nr:amidohydrolase [Chloroflexia bacterium]